MNIVLVSLSLFLIGTASAQVFGSPCDIQMLQKCQAKFNDEMKIDASLGVLDSDQLLRAIQGVWANEGAIGLQKTCLSFKNFKGCFENSVEYYNCVENPLKLLVDSQGTATGVTKTQAFNYDKIFNQFDFACGSGFMEFANNDQCGSSVFHNRTRDLNNCQSYFEQSVAQNPNDVCVFMRIATDCVGNVFSSACSNAPEMGWWGCQYELSGTQILFPQCTQLFCTYNEKKLN